MPCVIEINSFYKKLGELSRDGEWRVGSPVIISRYFECLEVKFMVKTSGTDEAEAMRHATADILPRLEATALEFQVNVNVAGGAEELEKPLSQCVAGFLTRECAGDAETISEFTKNFEPEKIKILFLCERDTLLIRIGD